MEKSPLPPKFGEVFEKGTDIATGKNNIATGI
jgi:hypothetical protein